MTTLLLLIYTSVLFLCFYICCYQKDCKYATEFKMIIYFFFFKNLFSQKQISGLVYILKIPSTYFICCAHFCHEENS